MFKVVFFNKIGNELDTITLTAGYSELLTSQPILQTMHHLALTLFLHQILAY